jgi:hypothetical protein
MAFVAVSMAALFGELDSCAEQLNTTKQTITQKSTRMRVASGHQTVLNEKPYIAKNERIPHSRVCPHWNVDCQSQGRITGKPEVNFLNRRPTGNNEPFGRTFGDSLGPSDAIPLRGLGALACSPPSGSDQSLFST